MRGYAKSSIATDVQYWLKLRPLTALHAIISGPACADAQSSSVTTGKPIREIGTAGDRADVTGSRCPRRRIDDGAMPIEADHEIEDDHDVSPQRRFHESFEYSHALDALNPIAPATRREDMPGGR
jgi:hypothetical protein